MTRQNELSPLAVVLGVSLLLAAGPPDPPASPGTSEQEAALRQALKADPITAPYDYTIRLRNGRVILAGRVGTKAVHDAAVRIAISLGIPFDDRLTIDTAEVYRSVAGAGVAAGPVPAGSAPTAYALSGIPPYVYPQPLFGYLDDPFYGFEPPVISYPPWWQAMSRARLGDAPGGSGRAAPEAPQPIPTNAVELTVDPLGFGVLRGTVPDEETREGLARKASRLPGLKGIINRLEIAGAKEGDAEPPPPAPAPVGAAGAEPPPPPRPFVPPPPEPGVVPPAAPAPVPAPGAGARPLSERIELALKNRPALKDLPIQASVSGPGGVVTLRGEAPSVLEAMLAYRAIEQTPGVRQIDDRLTFPVPAAGKPNPLVEQGRPEDVEPYLEAQLKRYLGDQAHIDRLRMQGDVLEIRGTIPSPADEPRVLAALRALPLLRGFRVEPLLRPE